MPSAPELSVVVLCYRAEDELPHVVAPLHEQMETAGVTYEIVLVANFWAGAADRTPTVAAQLAREHPNVIVISEQKQGDMGWDLRAGLAATSGDHLVYLDGDGQVPTEAVLAVHRRLRETGAQVAKGRRHFRDDGSIRSLTSLGFNLLFRWLFRTRGLWDVNGQPKGMTRSAYERLNLRTDDWFTDAEIVLKARELGFDIVEVPVRFLAKGGKPSQVGPRTAWEFLVNMFRWRIGRHRAQAARLEPRAGAIARARR